MRPDEEARAALSRLGAPHSSKDGGKDYAFVELFSLFSVLF